MSTPDTRIITKIKKCLALSESANPHEAAAAMRQAQKLMAQHNIDMAAVNRPEIIELGVSSRHSVSRPKRWELALVAGIAQTFGCRFYFLLGTSYAASRDGVYGKYIFVGTYEQVVIAEWTATALFNRHQHLRRERYNQLKSANLNRTEISTQLDSFSTGWVVAVVEKVVEMANPEVVEKAIEEKLNTLNLQDGIQAKRQAEISPADYVAGRELGRRESIHRPMGEYNGNGAKLLEQCK